MGASKNLGLKGLPEMRWVLLRKGITQQPEKIYRGPNIPVSSTWISLSQLSLPECLDIKLTTILY